MMNTSQTAKEGKAALRSIEEVRRSYERATGQSTASWGDSPTKERRETEAECVASTSAIIRGVERNLCASAPTTSRKRLEEFSARLSRARGRRDRERLEHEFDRFVKSAPHLRAAANRYIGKICEPIVRMSKITVRFVTRAVKKPKHAPLGTARRLAGRGR